MLTRKHFEELAKQLRETIPHKPEDCAAGTKTAAQYNEAIAQWRHDIMAVCAALRVINPRFDADRFKLAAGY